LNCSQALVVLRWAWRRLAETIRAVSNLEINDFWCRFLITDDIWIPLGESLTIQRFRPLWNQVVDGFGNNPPGAKRITGARPLWDELHPGRTWAKECAPARLPAEEIVELVTEYFEAV
jgi:hypothetical protein